MNKLTPAQKIAETLLFSTSNRIIYYPQKVTGTLQQYKIYPRTFGTFNNNISLGVFPFKLQCSKLL